MWLTLRWWMTLVTCLLLMGVGIFVAVVGGEGERPTGIGAALFFGFCSATSAWMLAARHRNLAAERATDVHEVGATLPVRLTRTVVPAALLLSVAVGFFFVSGLPSRTPIRMPLLVAGFGALCAGMLIVARMVTGQTRGSLTIGEHGLRVEQGTDTYFVPWEVVEGIQRSELLGSPIVLLSLRSASRVVASLSLRSDGERLGDVSEEARERFQTKLERAKEALGAEVLLDPGLYGTTAPRLARTIARELVKRAAETA